MSSYDSNQGRPYDSRIGAPPSAAIDAGLRAYMLRVYNYMAGGPRGDRHRRLLWRRRRASIKPSRARR